MNFSISGTWSNMARVGCPYVATEEADNEKRLYVRVEESSFRIQFPEPETAPPLIARSDHASTL
jgi:hypothetical protein